MLIYLEDLYPDTDLFLSFYQWSLLCRWFLLLGPRHIAYLFRGFISWYFKKKRKKKGVSTIAAYYSDGFYSNAYDW